MTSDAASDLPFRILNAYYEQTPLFLTRHHIDSYEHFVFNEMPRLIHGMNPITILKYIDPAKTEQGSYKVEIYIGGKVNTPSELNLEFGSPIVTLDSGKTVRRMFPNEARLRGLTYFTQIRMNIDIIITHTVKVGDEYVTKTTPLSFTNFPILKLPILLRSKLCSLGQEVTEDSMLQKGESPLEHGGYFIIDGAEKLLITREEQAFNSLYIARKSPTDLDTSVYATVVCQHPDTKMNRRFSMYLGRDDNLIRVSIPSVRGMVPVFILFRALGVESDNDIVRLIFPDAESEFTKRYEDMLIPSIEDAWPITTQAMAISFISTLTHQGSIASVLDIIRNHLFSHVPDMPLARAYYLADIVNKMIKSNAKLISNTDRDDISNQRLITTGTLLRDLFTAVWKDWTKTIGFSVDEKYNYNKTVYAGEKFKDIFSPGNITDIFKVDVLNTGIMKGFRGRWGTTPQNTKTGVLQPVGRISYYDALSHCRRILLDFDTSMKQKGPRHLHPSQIGYFCTNETPTGAHIGVTKNYSMLTYVSLSTPREPILTWLEKRGGMISIIKADKVLRSSGTRIKINGAVVGFSDTPIILLRVLKLLKWTACLAPLTSVSFNTIEREIRIYIDEGRPVRPLWHIDEGGVWPKMATYINSNPNFIPSWRDLVLGSLELTKNRTISDVDFIDPLQDRSNVSLEEYIKELEPYAGCIEYIDPYESNEAFISWWGTKDFTKQHTHIEIHPSTMLGLMVSLIPYANHNQSPRNQLSCSQSKQAIGYYANNYLQRYDTYGSQLCYGEAPIVRTLIYDHVGNGRVPYGFNCIVAMASTDGYNQDDGILFNKSSVERGLFRSLALRSYTALEEVDGTVEYKIANPKLITSWTDLKPGYDYSKLDENGIIREGEAIEDHTVLVGRYLENSESRTFKDASVLPTVFTKGRVDSVVVLHQNNGKRLVRIRILQERIPELGDKFGSRHGQKGTMGMLIPAENMPHTAEGIIPDVIVNPHGLTSRMTVAQLIECLFGRFGLEVAAKCNGTSFFNRENIVKTVGESLMSMGLHPHTENIMYCGTTGKQLPCSIFMGPLYFMRMKHLTSDKINSRGEGRREIRTHQPTGGRGNEGGMRIGEMERDAVSAHGVSLFLQESMMKRSDGTNFWICNGCGLIPIYNEKEKLFVCPSCDGPVDFSGTNTDTLSLIQPLKRSRVTFSKVEMPYALKLLEQEITTYTGCGLRFITEKSVGRLRDSVLNWNLEEGQDLVEEEQEQEQEQVKQNGGGLPESPVIYLDHEPVISIQKIESISNGEIAKIPEGVENKHANLNPLIGGTAPVDYSSPTGITYGDGVTTDGKPAPPYFDSQLAEVSDSQDPHIAIHSDLPDFKDRADTVFILNGGQAPVNHIDDKPSLPNGISDGYTHKGELPVINFIEPVSKFVQIGGEAPVDYIDPTPVKHDIEEVWADPQTWQKGGQAPVNHIDDKPSLPNGISDGYTHKGELPVTNFIDPISKSVQSGGVASVDIIGTDIKETIFNSPADANGLFVIPNPYVSPQMLPKEIEAVQSNPVQQPQVPANISESIPNKLLGEVLNTVQQGGEKKVVFENSEIRVVKLQ